MNYEDLSAELKEKAKACANAEELIALASQEGIELSDEQLESISGGFWDDFPCHDDLPGCGNYTSE